MAIKKFKVEVTQWVEVELDDSKLTDEFNKEFSSFMWPVDCLEDHANHIAQMEARGLIDYNRFVEGYGDLREMNCKVKVVDQKEESEPMDNTGQAKAV